MKARETYPDIFRMSWRYRNSGALVVEGVSNAANHGLIADDPGLDEKLNALFPDIIFTAEIYDRDLSQWIPEKRTY